jgi:hypothetical protein
MVYTPRLKKELVTELYKLGKQSNTPMTQLVNEMVREGIQRWRERKERKENNHEDHAFDRPPGSPGSPGV